MAKLEFRSTAEGLIVFVFQLSHVQGCQGVFVVLHFGAKDQYITKLC